MVTTTTTRKKKKYKKKLKCEEHENKLKEKIHGQFFRDVPRTNQCSKWDRLMKIYLKPEKEVLICETEVQSTGIIVK